MGEADVVRDGVVPPGNSIVVCRAMVVAARYVRLGETVFDQHRAASR